MSSHSACSARVDGVLKEIDAALFLVAGDEQIGKGDAFIAAALARTGVPAWWLSTRRIC